MPVLRSSTTLLITVPYNTLLDAGAEVDALADTYAGGTTETTLNLLVFAYIAYRRRQMKNPEVSTLTTLQLSIAALPSRRQVQNAVAHSAVAQRTMRRAEIIRSRARLQG